MWQLSRQNLNRQITKRQFFFETEYFPFEKKRSSQTRNQDLRRRTCIRYPLITMCASDAKKYEFIVNLTKKYHF